VIRRSPRPSTGWTTFSNELLTDDKLSFRSLGVLVYILSKPDDWTVRAEQLAKTHVEGRDAVRTSLDELEAAGYLVRQSWRTADGTFASEAVVYDSPKNHGITSPARETSAGYPTRLSQRGEPGPLTRTEEEGLSTKEYSRGAARRRVTTVSRPKSRRLVQPDDDTGGGDEGPVLGGSRRPTRDERNDVAAKRGASGYGLAMRLENGLKRAGVSGSAAAVDKGILAKQLTAKVRAGTHSYEQLASCVEVFVGSPDRYRSGDLKGWTQFLAALPKLEADAESMRRATAPAAEVYGGLDPYEGLT